MPESTDFATRMQEMLVNCGAGLAVLAGAALLYFVLTRTINSAERHGQLPERLAGTLRRIARCFVAVSAGILLLQSFGLLQSVVAAITGVLALVAIGFVAVWSVLSNALCSLILIVTRPFRVGDVISFPPDTFGGRVVNFNMLFTALETEDGFILQVPNNTFFQRVILRKKGVERICLGEQLYREQNARFDAAPTEPGTNGSPINGREPAPLLSGVN